MAGGEAVTNQDRINHLKSRIADLSERLPYADGQAYYDDKRKIEALSAELANLNQTINQLRQKQ